ncbi:MAG: hypothetical protein ACK504_11200 [Bacteroidota bacterium]
MITKKNIHKGLKLILVLSVPASIWFFSYLKKKSINGNKCLGVATVTKLSFGFKGNYSFHIEFYDNRNNLIKVKSTLIFGRRDSSIVKKKFPVVYNCDNPKEYCILITKDNFEKYNIPFPDSLKWVNKYLE